MDAASMNSGYTGTTGAVIVAAGKGTRMGTDVAKQFLSLAGEPIIVHTLRVFCQSPVIDRIVVVTSADDLAYMKQIVQRYPELHVIQQVVVGGLERQDSVRAGIKALGKECEWVLIHDGARPFVTPAHIASCLAQAQQSGAAVMAVPVKDTIKMVDESGIILSTPDRKSLWAVQTPQAFRVSELWDAHEWAFGQGVIATDDAKLLEEQGKPPMIVQGDYRNLKITTPEDLQIAEYMMKSKEETMLRIGQGFDVHQLVEGRHCIIGGIDIPFEKGLDGHSDADVLLHAITDAILGALGKGDIGRHFPDTDPAYKDADSADLLHRVWSDARNMGYSLGNLDATVIAQQPKLAPYIPQILQRLSEILDTEKDRLNVKATTSERLGFTGRGEGIAAMAVVCLTKTML